MTSFWRDETGADIAIPARFAKYALLIIILNEIRGAVVVAGIVGAYFR